MKKLILLCGCVLALGLSGVQAGGDCGGCKGKEKGKEVTEERV